MNYSKITKMELRNFVQPKAGDEYDCPQSPTGRALIREVQHTINSPSGIIGSETEFLEIWWSF